MQIRSRWVIDAAALRLLAAIFLSRLDTWTPAVRSVMNSSVAISRLVLPRHSRHSTSNSRAVRPNGRTAGPAVSENPAALAGAFRIRRAFLPGQPFVIELPGQPSAPGDLIVIRDEEPGWLQSEERGGADLVTLFAPEEPGTYTVEYLAAPDLAPAATLTIEVR
mgnify:CR=1 FL=1